MVTPAPGRKGWETMTVQSLLANLKNISLLDIGVKGIADYRIIYDVFDNILLIGVINSRHKKDMYA